MADKSFGVKRINLIGNSGTPNITSPNNLNLNATTVAISSDVSVGGEVVSNLVISSPYSVGIASTLPSTKLDIVGNAKVLGIVSATELRSSGLIVSGVATFSDHIAGVLRADNLIISGISTFQEDVYFGNDDRIIFGATNDLQIYNDGNNSYLVDSGVGSLYIRGTTSINLQSSDGTEDYAKFNVDGAAQLYYDNSKKFETTGYGISISNGGSDVATIGGPSNIIIDPAAVGDDTGSVRIKGDLLVDGTQFIVNSTSIELADFNVGIASTVASNVLLDGAGIGIGSTNVRKTLIWNNSSISLKSSENFDLSSGKSYKIDGTDVLTSTTLGSNVVSSSLTTVGTLNKLDVGDINSSGILTVTGATDLNGGLDVSGHTELDQLNVSGVSTFVGNINANSNLDVSGVSTFTGNINANGGLDVSGHTELDNVNISGITTIVGAADLNGDLDVDGHTELDNVNISGIVTTFDLNVDGHTELDQLNVSGVSTFAGNVDANGGLTANQAIVEDLTNNRVVIVGSGGRLSDSSNLTFDGTTLNVTGQTDVDNLNVSGLSTFVGVGTFQNDLYVGGTLYANITGTISGNAESATQLLYSRDFSVSGDIQTSSPTSFNGTGNVDLNVSLSNSFSANTSGIITAGSVTVGGATTSLVVDGDARITGILTIGTSSITIDGDNNTIGIGTAVTISSSGVNVAGVSSLTATTIYGDFVGDLNPLGKTYYVSNTGSNSNTGDNINKPFLTIQYALSVATNGDLINVSAGTYEETCPLIVPRGVTVKGAGLRATTIKPTDATKTNDVFKLNDVSTVEDFTVRNSYYNSTNDTGYAFAYATGIAITTRSPYIQRITVLNTGSTVTTSDPYGYDTADSPPTSYIAGRGAKVDGSLVASNSLEAGMLFNEVTFFTPNNKGLVLTNGARVEYLNCFHYFASQAIVGTSGTVGIAGTADARLKFTSPGVTPSVNDVVKLYESGSVVAVGTITEYADPYAKIEGKGFGTFTSVGIGTTQDVRFYQSDGTTQTGIASAIAYADYTMFGAEMRSVGCAFEYGTQGVVADGIGVKLRLFATNFNHIGSGKDMTNDPTLVIQANEVTEVNGGQVSYVSIDQSGDFRVGDSLYINQETGNVSFAATSYNLEVLGNLNVTDGSNTSTLSPTSLTVGYISLSGNEIESTTGDININPAGSNEVNVTGNLNVSGILTASVIQVGALQKGDTSIALDDTGSDGTIRLNTDGTEVMRVTNTQKVGINSSSPSYALDVVGVINSSTELRVNGVNVVDDAVGQALALAIALG